MRYIIIFLVSILYSQNSNYGGGPNTFYKNMYTAREVAMGSAGIASAEGYLANIWNPACIIDALENKNFIFGINFPPTDQIFSGIPFDADNPYNVSKKWGSTGVLNKKFFKNKQKVIYLGGSIIYQNYSDIWETRVNINNEIEPVGNFDLSQSLFLMSIAGKFDKLSIGISSKVIYSDDLYSNSLSSRFGIDAGLVLSFPEPRFLPFIEKLKYGFVLKSDQDKYNHQTTTGLGISAIGYWNDSFHQIFSFDIISGEFLVPEFHFGTDLKFLKNSIKSRKGPDGQFIWGPNKKGQYYYYLNPAHRENAVIVEKTYLPKLNLYAGINSTIDGIRSLNVGSGINLPFGLELDLVYSHYFQNNIISQYYSLVNSTLRITLQINFK